MKSILISGGAGFFGRTLTKGLLEKTDIERICIYSRDEWKQAKMRSEIKDPDQRLRYFIGDVRDSNRLTRAMSGVDAVIHAAALKRIETAFYNPIELCKTNIDGTINVIQAAQDCDVKKVVFLSTDKAFQPCSAYGLSKALAECLILNANNTSKKDGTIFSLARYGNVAGSTGSVIPIWKKMIAEGAKVVNVSDPEVTRFWMWDYEAVNLVYDLLLNMKGGETAVPVLPAYRLGDLAEAMNVEMNITGLGKFEKLHESMLEGMSSDKARRLTVEELRDMVKYV